MVCMNCGKRLKDAKSLERGFGPVCWRKTHPKTENRKKSIKVDTAEGNNNIPGQISFSELSN